MPSRKLIRGLSLALGCALVLVYVLAKYHFFTAYIGSTTAAYLQAHSKYWLAMAVLALAVWLVERRYD